jgi:hypothetical protein
MKLSSYVSENWPGCRCRCRLQIGAVPPHAGLASLNGAVAASWINGLGECYTFATRAATRRWQVGAELDGGRGVG